MRMRYLALAGWLLADLGLALAFVGLGDSGPTTPPTTSTVPGPDSGTGDVSSPCTPGIQANRPELTINLAGLPIAQPGQLDPPDPFVQAVQAQARAELDRLGVSGHAVGLIQTFTNLDDDSREVPTSLWVNVALLDLDEADALGPALPEDDPAADLRVRHFIGDNANGTAQTEWFLVKECR